MVNLKQIYVAMVEYSNDYDGYICPYYTRHTGQTWEDLLKPYTKGGKGLFYFTNQAPGTAGLRDYMLFFCPTRIIMDHTSRSGYMTNYLANGSVMKIQTFSNPWETPSTNSLKKFSDFKYPEKIMLLSEEDWWVGFPTSQFTMRNRPFVHNGTVNFLMMDGQVKNIKGDSDKDDKIPVWGLSP